MGHADYFQSNYGHASVSQGVTEDIISAINAQGGITDSGRIYGCSSSKPRGMLVFLAISPKN